MPPATFHYEKNEAFVELAEGQDAVFESNTRFLVFAASVGHARSNRVTDPDDNGEIRWNYISQNNRLSVIVASLAYADTGDAEVLLDPDRQIDSLVAYGAGGARILKNEIVDEPGENLDNLVDFLQQHRDIDSLEEQVGILEQIESEISSLRPSSEEAE
jgi:dnd system-associated protein 4